MTLRVSQFWAVCGLGLLSLPGVAHAQAPRYQSPGIPSAPQPQYQLPVTTPITPNGTVVEDVVVHVNDQIISRSDVERGQQQLTQEMQQGGASPAEIEQRQKDLLRDMIDKQLLLSRGKELGINADAEVIRRLDEIRKQNHLDTMEDLEKAARQQGVSFEDFKASIRDNVITQEVVRDEVGRRLQMTQAQEQAYYEAHKQDFAQPEQIRLSEILIPTPADANDATVAQAKEKAQMVEDKLKSGQKFDAMAEAYSGGPTADKGGDLGLYKRGALAKVLEDQTFPLKAGESTAPIRTKQGFVILKVTEHQEAGVPPLKDIEPQIQEAMYGEQMQPALRAYLTKLREEAYIDIRAGYVDSGASPHETKPVFTAYAPPAPKKKASKEKKRFDRGTVFSTAATTGAVASTAANGTVSSPDLAKTSTMTTATAQTVSANGKPKKVKVKREKVRLGQAPRNSLPPTQEATAVGTDVGVGAQSVSAAPGTAIAPLDTAQVSSDPGANPLNQTAAPTGKTRFSEQAKTYPTAKKQAKAKKVKDKQLATPAPASKEEAATIKTQSAPLGLNGDTAKKKKKKKTKGEQKERLQSKPPSPPPPAPVETPAKAPDRGTPTEGTHGTGTPAPTADKTSLPPASAAPANSTPDSGQPPATPNNPIPTPPPQ